jgi:hypothetical protein
MIQLKQHRVWMVKRNKKATLKSLQLENVLLFFRGSLEMNEDGCDVQSKLGEFSHVKGSISLETLHSHSDVISLRSIVLEKLNVTRNLIR